LKFFVQEGEFCAMCRMTFVWLGGLTERAARRKPSWPKSFVKINPMFRSNLFCFNIAVAHLSSNLNRFMS